MEKELINRIQSRINHLSNPKIHIKEFVRTAKLAELKSIYDWAIKNNYNECNSINLSKSNILQKYTEKAKEIINKEFKGKLDKGGDYYVNHLYRVSNKLFREYDKTVAFLHDLLEDTEYSEKSLRFIFPDIITDSVVCLTKQKGESYSSYLDRVKSNEISIRVKIADLEDNMDIKRLNILTDKDCERLKKYHKAWLELTNLV